LEFDGEASPLIEEPARIVNRLTSFRVGNAEWLLALQPRPSIEVGLRHTIRNHAFAFFELCFLGFGRGRYVANYAPDCIICQLSVFHT
jgi:hypothetical protein